MLRKFRRKAVIWAALLETPLGIMDCVILSLSVGGVRLRGPFPDRLLLQPVTLVLENFGRFNGKVVRKTDGEIGVHFQDPPETIGRRLGNTIPFTA